jgi:hypothetical protein
MSRLQTLLYGRSPRRPDPEPLELDDTRVVAAGTLAWLLALVALVVADLFGAEVHGWWLAMCGCGALLGVVGLRYVARRKQALARRAREG